MLFFFGSEKCSFVWFKLICFSNFVFQRYYADKKGIWDGGCEVGTFWLGFRTFFEGRVNDVGRVKKYRDQIVRKIEGLRRAGRENRENGDVL